jgi:hypothetical protein
VTNTEPAAARVEPTAAGVEPVAATVDSSAAEETTFVPAPRQLMSAAAAEPAADMPAATPRPAARDAALSAPAESPTATAQSPKLVPGNSLFSFEKATPAASKSSQGSPANVSTARDVSANNSTAPTTNNATAPTARPSSSDAPSAAAFPVSYITEKPLTDRAAAAASSAAALRLLSEPQALRVGERRQLKLLLKTDAPLGLLALSFRLDPRLLAVRAVTAGTLAGTDDARVTHSVTSGGVLLVTVAPARADAAVTGAGVLLTLEVEALAQGAEPLRFDADDVYLVATDGRKVLVKVMTDQLSVR